MRCREFIQECVKSETWKPITSDHKHSESSSDVANFLSDIYSAKITEWPGTEDDGRFAVLMIGEVIQCSCSYFQKIKPGIRRVLEEYMQREEHPSTVEKV